MTRGITPDFIAAHAVTAQESEETKRIALELREGEERTIIWLGLKQAIDMARELLNPK